MVEGAAVIDRGRRGPGARHAGSSTGPDSNRLDRRYLSMVAEAFGGGPVGIETIAAALSEPRDTIEDTMEPYLIQSGFLQRTPRGRVITPRAWEHLGLNPPAPTPVIRNDLFADQAA